MPRMTHARISINELDLFGKTIWRTIPLSAIGSPVWPTMIDFETETDAVAAIVGAARRSGKSAEYTIKYRSGRQSITVHTDDQLATLEKR